MRLHSPHIYRLAHVTPPSPPALASFATLQCSGLEESNDFSECDLAANGELCFQRVAEVIPLASASDLFDRRHALGSTEADTDGRAPNTNRMRNVWVRVTLETNIHALVVLTFVCRV